MRVVQEGAHIRVYGYSKHLPWYRLNPKRALLSYLVNPVVNDLNGLQTNRFSNHGIALSWAQVLNELGYKIDIIDWSDKDFRPLYKYDIAVFHGGKNFSSIYTKLLGKPLLIYFATGSYWKFANASEDKRFRNFWKRHSVMPSRDRYVHESESPVNEASSGIIALGDPSMRNTFPSNFPPVVTINNASYPDDHFELMEKDYSRARKNFLFFAGAGNIHKGLDLLIDSFKDLDEHLYIVTVPDKSVMNVFKQELKLPNIHLIGEVGMRDDKFYEIMDKCAFVILPSCSEGQAGSVVEAMNQGLVPIVSEETRLDARRYGVVLKDCSIAEIKKTVRKMAVLRPDQVSIRAHKTRQVAMAAHSPESFRKNLKAAINRIVTVK